MVVAARVRHLVRRPDAVDATLAIVFAVAGLLHVTLADVPGPLSAKLLAVGTTSLPLAWRTAAPATTTALATSGFALAALAGLSAEAALIPRLAPIVAVYSLGAHGRWTTMVSGAAVAIAGYAIAGLADDRATLGTVTLDAVLVLAALGVGRSVQLMGTETDVLAARNLALERERDERARAAVAAERVRIARELHDLIGHSISVMGVQAGAVRRILAPELERERELLLAVERTGRDAVAEMHRLLGLLRSDDDDGRLEAPPTLERADDLVADLRRAGLDVELHVEGSLDDVSPGCALAAFRILQEGLTNALKHAPGARVTATVRRDSDTVEITVEDNGGRVGKRPVSHGGHGLVGMRERVALYGGTLKAGPRGDGGFAVAARLPAAR